MYAIFFSFLFELKCMYARINACYSILCVVLGAVWGCLGAVWVLFLV